MPTVPEVFLPLTVGGFTFPRILIRTSVEPHRLDGAVRSELQAINKNLVRQEPAPLDDLIAKYSYSRPRFSVFLMGVFASVGLLLVGTGIYGVMACSVSQRTREIGIRMALRAEQLQIWCGRPAHRARFSRRSFRQPSNEPFAEDASLE